MITQREIEQQRAKAQRARNNHDVAVQREAERRQK